MSSIVNDFFFFLEKGANYINKIILILFKGLKNIFYRLKSHFSVIFFLYNLKKMSLILYYVIFYKNSKKII